MEKAGKQKERGGWRKTESSSSISTDGSWVGVAGPGSRRDPGLYIVVTPLSVGHSGGRRNMAGLEPFLLFS